MEPKLKPDLINLRIHVKGDVANVSFMSAGEKSSSTTEKRVFNFDVDWSFAGDVFAGPVGAKLTNASLNWFTN